MLSVLCVVFVRRRIDCVIALDFVVTPLDLLLFCWKCIYKSTYVCFCESVRARCCIPQNQTTFYLTEFIIFLRTRVNCNQIWWPFLLILLMRFFRVAIQWIFSSVKKKLFHFIKLDCVFFCVIRLNFSIHYHHKKCFFSSVVGYVLWWQSLFLPLFYLSFYACSFMTVAYTSINFFVLLFLATIYSFLGFFLLNLKSSYNSKYITVCYTLLFLRLLHSIQCRNLDTFS